MADERAGPPSSYCRGHCQRRSLLQLLSAVRDSAETSTNGFSTNRCASNHREEAASVSEAAESGENQTSVLGRPSNSLQNSR